MNKIKEEARKAIMTATQEAMKQYAILNPTWLANFNQIKDSRLAWINEYIMSHTTPDQRKNV